DNKDDKDSTTRLVNDVIKTNVGGKTLIYRNNPVITDDLDIPNKKYIDDKIKDFKIGKWKEVGIVSSDKTNINYNFIRDKRYKVYYNWGQSTSPNVIKEFIFDPSNNNYLESFIEENNKISILWLQDNKIFIAQKGRNYGHVSKLKEYQEENTYQINSKTLDIMAPTKINIEKPLKINSTTLNIKELAENTFDIELKNNPTPNIPQWKEVGTKQDNKTINYNFVKNKRYRIYYNYCVTTDNTEYSWICKEFIYTESKIQECLEYFMDTDSNHTWLIINQNIISMMTRPYPFSFGNLWKLEELQE
ncbi:MAG: hypothetical protein H9Q65_05925, partial [Spiroplasma ixodetis]|nr:hypothetical protein [Spiroplasma ixodetis]